MTGERWAPRPAGDVSRCCRLLPVFPVNTVTCRSPFQKGIIRVFDVTTCRSDGPKAGLHSLRPGPLWH